MSTSLSAIDESLAASRKNSFLALIGTIIVTTLIAGQPLRRWVSGPLERLIGAMRSIAQGDLEQSIGVSAYAETGIESVDQLIHEADQALYRSKEGGRNRVTRADSIA